MSRFIRLYEKKRGNRRTGSKALGRLGEALFFGVFFALGCVALAAMLAAFVWPEWRVNRQFASARCVVLAKQIGVKEATLSGPAKYRPEITVRYTVEGRTYETNTYDITERYSTDQTAVQAMVDRFEVGQAYPCWYDPMNPGIAVLVRGYSGWLYLLLLIPASFITIGGGRLIYTVVHWNTSAERRALLAQRAAGRDLFEVDDGEPKFPTVPADANLTNSPGTTLAYRLPIATTTVWKLFAASTACVLWNSLAAMFVVMAVRSFARGEPDWTLTALVCPMVLVGIGLVAYLVRMAVLTTGVGPTRIEISAHPLNPGEQYDLFLSQGGRLVMHSLAVWLACDERATYRQGTDTRTETRRVYEERCFLREEFEIHQGLPFESRCQIRVPTGAMHSFHAGHNEVSWKLIVKGSLERWPNYERVFQIVVNPVSNGHSHA